MIALILAAALNCSAFHIDPLASQSFAPTAATHAPGSCHVRMSHGYPIPDPACTPGAINPTVTAKVLRNPAFRTACVRDMVTSESRKRVVYLWYGIAPPSNNRGPTQTCELDHVDSLGLAAADTLANVWPECGPPGVPVGQRYFKIKDGVEDRLMKEVRDAPAGTADQVLSSIQRQIAADWTVYLPANEQH